MQVNDSINQAATQAKTNNVMFTMPEQKCMRRSYHATLGTSVQSRILDGCHKQKKHHDDMDRLLKGDDSIQMSPTSCEMVTR